MTGLLCLISAPALAPEDDARSLVGRLGAEGFDDRVAAIKGLERLGPAALPALREAAGSADPRVRSRARDVIETVARRAEAERSSRPTMVRLDFRDRPLGAVVEAMNARDDLGLVLRTGPPMRGMGMMIVDPGRPDPLAQLKERKVTVEEATPLPFWAAIDRLCEAAALRYDLTPQPRFGVTQGSLALMGDRTGRGPVSDWGAFRVQVSRVHAAAGRDFAGAPGQAGGLTVSLAVLVEPGLAVHQAGPVRVEEAADDRGRPLAPREAAGVAGRNPGVGQLADLGSFALDLALEAPDPPGASIRRLLGKVPVVVLARELDPVVVPLARGKAAVTTIQGRAFGFAIDGAESPRSIIVTARPLRGLANRPGGGAGSPAPNFGSRGVGYDRGQQHLEFFDADGRRLDHVVGSQQRGADQLGFYDRYQLIIGTGARGVPGGEGAGGSNREPPVATELRYYEFTQKEVEIPFDFRDIPLP